MIGGILFAVFLYVITTELWRFVVDEAGGPFFDRPGRRQAVGGQSAAPIFLGLALNCWCIRIFDFQPKRCNSPGNWRYSQQSAAHKGCAARMTKKVIQTRPADCEPGLAVDLAMRSTPRLISCGASSPPFKRFSQSSTVIHTR